MGLWVEGNTTVSSLRRLMLLLCREEKGNCVQIDEEGRTGERAVSI
jgi:hypothetical protein